MARRVFTSLLRGLGGQADTEASAPFGTVGGGDRASVFGENAGGQVEAQAGAVWLVGGERLKHPLENILGNPRPVVHDAQADHPAWLLPQARFHLAAVPDHVERVEKEVDQDRRELI